MWQSIPTSPDLPVHKSTRRPASKAPVANIQIDIEIYQYTNIYSKISRCRCRYLDAICVNNIYVYIQKYLKESRLCPSSTGKYSNLFAEDQTSIFLPPFPFSPLPNTIILITIVTEGLPSWLRIQEISFFQKANCRIKRICPFPSFSHFHQILVLDFTAPDPVHMEFTSRCDDDLCFYRDCRIESL